MTDTTNTWVYRHANGATATLTFPFGLIPPPTLELHAPSVGPQTFFYQPDGSDPKDGK